MADPKWYIVHAYSNFEKKVAEAIREQAESQGLDEDFEQIEVPIEEVAETVRGKRKVVEKRRYPGYVMVKMRMNDRSYHLVKNTPKVTGFLGDDGGKKPIPVPERQVQTVLGGGDEVIERKPIDITFEIGEEVTVKEGPFQSFSGRVEEIDEERGRLKVTVSIFGRATPVDLEYSQVEQVK